MHQSIVFFRRGVIIELYSGEAIEEAPVGRDEADQLRRVLGQAAPVLQVPVVERQAELVQVRQRHLAAGRASRPATATARNFRLSDSRLALPAKARIRAGVGIRPLKLNRAI